MVCGHFLGCNSLVEVTVPATIKSWEGSVFNSCQKLVTFRGMGLEYVTYADFAQCYALTDVYLPKVKRDISSGICKLSILETDNAACIYAVCR